MAHKDAIEKSRLAWGMKLAGKSFQEIATALHLGDARRARSLYSQGEKLVRQEREQRRKMGIMIMP